jgi:hypothetical protein
MKKLTLVAALGLIGAFGGVGDVWGQNSMNCRVKEISAITKTRNYYNKNSGLCQEDCEITAKYEVVKGECPEDQEKSDERLCEEVLKFEISRITEIPIYIKDKGHYCRGTTSRCAPEIKFFARTFPDAPIVKGYPDLRALFEEITENPTVWQCQTAESSTDLDENTNPMSLPTED